MNSPDDPIALGTVALAQGDWLDARRYFESVIARGPTGAALDGLSDALFWLEEIDASLHHRTRAYRRYREEGRLPGAARAALWLAMGHISVFGNAAVANGWMQRAERLLNETGPCAEQGWLEHLRGKMTSDPAETARHARKAVDIARAHGDVDLEVWALSEEGRALVAMGRVDEGMAMLDEAVATATDGAAHDLFIVGNACCNMLSACDRAADFDRAMQWCRVVDEFSRHHRFPPIFHYCRAVYSGVLIATGRWDEAEAELTAALRTVEGAYPLEKVHSITRLAILDVRRGRLEEAGERLGELVTHGIAAEPVALLHLARGDSMLAAALLDRRIDAIGEGLAAVPLLRLLVEAHLRVGNVESARIAGARLSSTAERSRCPPIQAMALQAAARIDHASGRSADAIFEQACSMFDRLGMVFDAAVTRLEWARVQTAADREIAVEDARQALSTFERLGARPYADQAAALLRELGAGSRPGPHATGVLTRRESEVLGLLCHGLSNAAIGARLLISPKTVEHHVGRILLKLDVSTRTAAVAWAMRHAASSSDRE